MKIITYNVNGIRAAMKKGLIGWLTEQNADMLLFQEIKLSETELVEADFTTLGYHCYWHPAQKKGYSGVALLTKIEPKNIVYGIEESIFDDEGRVLIAEFDHFSLFSTYFPSGSSGDNRQEVKYQFLDYFHSYIEKYKLNQPHIIIGGDVNICHREIDIHNPKSNQNTSGFLPEERTWISKFLDSGFVDTFRHLHSEPHNYTWWSYRANAKVKNLGWRIDYLFISESLKEHLVQAQIYPEVLMSDHCPSSIQIKI